MRRHVAGEVILTGALCRREEEEGRAQVEKTTKPSAGQFDLQSSHAVYCHLSSSHSSVDKNAEVDEREGK